MTRLIGGPLNRVQIPQPGAPDPKLRFVSVPIRNYEPLDHETMRDYELRRKSQERAVYELSKTFKTAKWVRNEPPPS